MRKNALTIMMTVVASTLSFWAQAQTSAKAEKDKRKQSIDFEEDLIKGEVKKPELFYLLQKKQFNFKRLIKLRDDFLPEMRRTAEDTKPHGSAD